MSLLLETKDGIIYPYSIDMLRAENPHTSMRDDPSDECLAEYGIYRVDNTERPEVLETQYVEEADPARVDGVYCRQWRVVDHPEEFIAAREAIAEERRMQSPSAIHALLEAIGKAVVADKIRADELPPEDVKALAGLFRKWEPGMDVKSGEILRHDSGVYVVVQDHITEKGQEPTVENGFFSAKSDTQSKETIK